MKDSNITKQKNRININKLMILVMLLIAIFILICIKYYIYTPYDEKEDLLLPITNDIYEEEVTNSYEGYTTKIGYMMINSKEIISSYIKLQEYCNTFNTYIYDGQGNIINGKLDFLLKQYNEQFFEKKSLALVYVPLSSGSNKVEFIGAYKIKNNVKIKYDITYPENGIGTADMNGYLIIVEIDKDINNIL